MFPNLFTTNTLHIKYIPFMFVKQNPSIAIKIKIKIWINL
jgi:hypothetical protein